MRITGKLVLATLGGIAAGSIVWTYVAHRQHAPCPAWLSLLLDDPCAEALAGGDVIIRRTEIGKGMRVMDVGAGFGRLTIPIAGVVGRNGDVAAIDIQPAMLQKLEQRVREAGLDNISILRADIQSGPPEEEGFDRAILVTVLGEIPDRESGLRSVYRALKPGGILSVTEVFPDPHFQSRSSVFRLALETDFVPHESFGNRLVFTETFRKPLYGHRAQNTAGSSTIQHSRETQDPQLR